LLFTFTSYFFIRLSILFPEWFLHLELPDWLLRCCDCFCAYTLASTNLAIIFILTNQYTAIARAMTHVNNRNKNNTNIIHLTIMPTRILASSSMPNFALPIGRRTGTKY
jgi:hypothetical protein